MKASDSESKLEVASSKIKMRGSARIARAIETRCRCPPESFTPLSPTTVSYFFSKPSANSSTPDMRPNRAIEKKGFLQHDAQLPAVGIQGYLRQVDAIHQHAPARRHIKRRN